MSSSFIVRSDHKDNARCSSLHTNICVFVPASCRVRACVSSVLITQPDSILSKDTKWVRVYSNCTTVRVYSLLFMIDQSQLYERRYRDKGGDCIIQRRMSLQQVIFHRDRNVTIRLFARQSQTSSTSHITPLLSLLSRSRKGWLICAIIIDLPDSIVQICHSFLQGEI